MVKTIDETKKRLDQIYSRIDDIEHEIQNIYLEYEQLLEDKDLLEIMLMHQMNKEDRKTEYRR